MALYTLMNRDDVFRNVGPTPQETELYNTIGRTSGSTQSSNPAGLFEKRARSIENAIGTTLAAPVSLMNDALQNAKTDRLLKDNNQRMNDVYRQFGFNGREDYDRQLEATAEGSAEEQRLLNIPGLQEALQAQAKSNADKVEQNAREYKDYAENDYISQKINQDRGKFAGSAINTLSTASDVLGLTNGPVANAIQGGIEGLADELEENGFQNFDANRALKNAATGAVTGAVVGKLNQGVNKMLQPNGNLFKGGNALTRTINDLGSKTALGRVGSTLATGAARGALSGAVGGATGAGVSSALQGADIGTGIANAFQGAVQGAKQGALTGGAMAGINSAINKTPFMQQVNQAKQDWQNSGKNFKERFDNTRTNNDTWGNRLVNNAIDSANAVKQGFQNVGEGLRTLTGGNVGPNATNNMSLTDQAENMTYQTTTNTRRVDATNSQAVMDYLDEDAKGIPQTAPAYRAGEAFDEAVADLRNNYTDTELAEMLRNTNNSKIRSVIQGALKTSNTPTSVPVTNETPQAINEQETELYRTLSGDSERGDEITQQGGYETQQENVDVVPSKTSRESKLRFAQGKELLGQYGTVDQPTARATKAVESVQEIAKAGFTKPGDVERMANVVTGSNGEVSKLTANLIKNAKPVNTFDGETEGQNLNDFVDKSIELNALYGTNEGKSVKRLIQANLRSLPSHAEGSVTFEDNPEDVFRVVRNLESKAAELEGRGGSTYHRATIQDIHQAKVIKDTANLLKDRIFDGVDVKQALTPEVATNLKAYDPENKAWADYVDNKIMNAKDIRELRSVQAPWVRMNKYIDNAYIQSATVGGRLAGEDRVPTTKGGIINTVVNATWNSNPARRARANLYGKMADRSANQQTQIDTPTVEEPDMPIPNTGAQTALTSSTVEQSPSTQIYNTIGRTAGQVQDENVANYLATAVNEQTATPNTLEGLAGGNTTTASPTSVYGAINGTQAQSNSYFQPTGDYWTDLIGRAMSLAIDADDAQAFGTLYGMYQDAISKASNGKDTSDPTNWSATDRSNLLKAQNALSQIDQLERTYTDAVGEGGGNSIQGNLRQLANNISGGNLDPSADSYVKYANSIGAGLIKNLVNLGSTEYDAKRYIDYLPKLTDTKEQASRKLQDLRQAYEDVIANLNSVYGA